MPRKRIKEANQQIAEDFVTSGFTYKVIGDKYGKIGSRGGVYLSTSASNTGKEIVNSSGVQKALAEMLPKEGEETRKYVRKKLYSHAENKQNPHISLKAVELMAKTEAMLTERVQMDATTRNMDVYVDYTQEKSGTTKP